MVAPLTRDGAQTPLHVKFDLNRRGRRPCEPARRSKPTSTASHTMPAMEPDGIFNVWCEKSRVKSPKRRARFSEATAVAEFVSRPEVAELANLSDRHVIAALLRHVNLKLALDKARRLNKSKGSASSGASSVWSQSRNSSIHCPQ